MRDCIEMKIIMQRDKAQLKDKQAETYLTRVDIIRKLYQWKSNSNFARNLVQSQLLRINKINRHLHGKNKKLLQLRELIES